MRPDSSSGLRPRYDFDLPPLVSDRGSRGKVFRAIPKGARVLDVGCDTGRFGERLIVERACRVDGIEPDPRAAQEAASRLDTVYCRKVEACDSFRELAGYDAVLFLDVLEHLVDPWSVLDGAISILEPGGCVYIVTPNVAHISVIRRLLLGRFDYAQHGTMDRTHLRWFTRSSLRSALEGVGFGEVEISVVPVVPRVSDRGWVRRRLRQALARRLPDLFGGSLVATGRSTRHRIAQQE